MPTFRRILIAVDFSETSLRAIQVGGELASRLGAEVFILHVVDDRPVAVGPGLAVDLTSVEASVLEATKDRLLHLVQDVLPKPVARTVLVKPGIPHGEVLATATERQVDLVVVGTHGRTGISRAILGSHAETIVRRSPVPVLVVK